MILYFQTKNNIFLQYCLIRQTFKIFLRLNVPFRATPVLFVVFAFKHTDAAGGHFYVMFSGKTVKITCQIRRKTDNAVAGYHHNVLAVKIFENLFANFIQA